MTPFFIYTKGFGDEIRKKSNVCTTHFRIVCTRPVSDLYVQIPYGIPVYVQIPCLLFLKPQK